MKYFLVKSNLNYERVPTIIRIPLKEISPSDLSNKNYYKFKSVTVLPIYEREEFDFIDCVSSPIFLISDICMDVVKIYNPSIVSKNIVLLSEKSGKMKTYHLPLLPVVNCLTEKSKFNSDKSSIEYAELDLAKVKNNNIFYIGDSTGNYTVIRLDVLESMLKRGVRGFHISELDIR